MLVPKKYNQTGLLGLGEQRPTQVAGVMQRVAYDAPPTICDKFGCGSRNIQQDLVDRRRYYCLDCHADWFIVVAPWRRSWMPAR